jgi:hypothetical protein
VSRVGRVQINRPGATGPVTPPTIPDDPPPAPPGPADPVAYLALIVADGAVAAWPLDENDATTTYRDVIGSLDATLDQATTTGALASTPIGPSTDHSPHFLGTGGLSTDPNDLSLVVAHDPLLEVGTGDFAMEWWAKLDAFPTGATACCAMNILKDDLSSYILGELGGPGTGADQGRYRMQDVNNVAAASPATFDDQLLHHVVMTRRSDSYFTIIDGIEVGTATPGFPITFSTTEVLNLVGIQYTPLAGNNLYTAHGQVAWCAWYNVGLTTDQAAAHRAMVP